MFRIKFTSYYIVITRKDLVITRKDLIITRKFCHNYEKICRNFEKRSRNYEKRKRSLLPENNLVITRKGLVITRKLSHHFEKIMSQRWFSDPKLCTLLYKFKERWPMYVASACAEASSQAKCPIRSLSSTYLDERANRTLG